MTDDEYSKDDFVYVDPDTRTAIRKVQWDKHGSAIPMEWPRPEKDGAKRYTKKRYYPWGTYATMCKLYKLKGKVKDKDAEGYITIEDAINKLQSEPYWD